VSTISNSWLQYLNYASYYQVTACMQNPEMFTEIWQLYGKSQQIFPKIWELPGEIWLGETAYFECYLGQY